MVPMEWFEIANVRVIGEFLYECIRQGEQGELLNVRVIGVRVYREFTVVCTTTVDAVHIIINIVRHKGKDIAVLLHPLFKRK